MMSYNDAFTIPAKLPLPASSMPPLAHIADHADVCEVHNESIPIAFALTGPERLAR